MGDMGKYVLPSTEEVFPDLVVYPAFDEDTGAPNPPPSTDTGQSGQSGGSGDEAGEDQ